MKAKVIHLQATAKLQSLVVKYYATGKMQKLHMTYFERGKGIWCDIESGDLHVTVEVVEFFWVEHEACQLLMMTALSQNVPTSQGNIFILISVNASSKDVSTQSRSIKSWGTSTHAGLIRRTGTTLLSSSLGNECSQGTLTVNDSPLYQQKKQLVVGCYVLSCGCASPSLTPQQVVENVGHILQALCRHKIGHSCVYNVNISYNLPAMLHTVHFIGHVGFGEATGAFLPQSLSSPGRSPTAMGCVYGTSPVQAVLLTQAADPGPQSHTACSWSTTGSWRYLPLPEGRQASNVCQWTSSKTWTRLLNCCFCCCC